MKFNYIEPQLFLLKDKPFFTYKGKLIFTILYVGAVLSTRMYICTREIVSEIFRNK